MHFDPQGSPFSSVDWSGDSEPELVELELASADDVPLAEPPAPRGSVAGTALSVVLHVWLIALLAGTTFERPQPLTEPPLDTRMVETEVPRQPDQVIKYELANPNDRDFEVREVVNAASVGLSQTNTPVSESRPVPVPELAPTELHRVYDVPQGVQIDQRVVVKGTTGEGLIQLESALDRITWEIADNLKERKVLVVWMLDKSGSMIPQYEVIARRLKRIYGELGALEEVGQIARRDQPLLSGVVAFGEKTTFMTGEPTDRVEDILQAVQSVEVDESGIENVFSAVCSVMDRWSKFRAAGGRRIMLIVVTDEAGDDFATHLEPAIQRCARHGAKAYVVGPPAVFGRREGYVAYVAPENGRTYQLPVDLGPETPVFENVDLPFWFDGPQFTYLSAGFGPYALTRLVQETGGIYFMTNMITAESLTPVGVYDPEALKPFEPDYRFGSPKQYLDHLRQHPLRYAVIRAAQLSLQHPPEGTPRLDLRVTPNNFRQVATDAQRTVAVSQYMIDTILQAFPSGIEQELEKEPSPRWRMAFCLSYGRLLAQQVRCFEYNAACAHMKGSLSTEDVRDRSNHWVFRPDRELNYAANLRRTARLAEDLLKRVTEEAPGTPWAALAARELRHPFGIHIEQRFIPPAQTAPAAPAPPGNQRPRVRLAPDPQPPTPAAPPTPPPAPPKLPKL